MKAARSRKILFLCVANSARSQMAEGIAKQELGPDTLVASAGSAPSTVHPLAVRVMAEVGVDISPHRSKSVDDLQLDDVDVVVTLCAEEVCPVFLGAARRLHWPLPDPAAVVGDEEERLAAFRAVRDDLLQRIRSLEE